MSLNICSLKSNFLILQLEITDNFRPSVIGICETKMTKEIETLYNIAGYSMFTNNSQSNKEGVALYIKNSIPVMVKPAETIIQTGNETKSWRVFHDKLLMGRCFWGFVLPVLEYCSAVWCSAADTHLKLLDRVVSGACFIAGGVLNCDFSHRRSVAVLCMLYRSGVTEAPTLWRSTCALCASPGYTRCFDRTSVYFCASSLQNHTVSQDFYSPLSISLE